MLAFFSDMANSYGKEIKAILHKDLVIRVLSKLRRLKVRRYEAEINQQEQVNNLNKNLAAEIDS